MHFIITDAWLARSRAVHLSGTKLVLAAAGLSLVLMLLAAALYHWVFLKGARDGWPVIGGVVRLITQGEAEERSRFVRENLEVMLLALARDPGARNVAQAQGRERTPRATQDLASPR